MNERKQIENKIEAGCWMVFGVMAVVIVILLFAIGKLI